MKLLPLNKACDGRGGGAWRWMCVCLQRPPPPSRVGSVFLPPNHLATWFDNMMWWKWCYDLGGKLPGDWYSLSESPVHRGKKPAGLPETAVQLRGTQEPQAQPRKGTSLGLPAQPHTVHQTQTREWCPQDLHLPMRVGHSCSVLMCVWETHVCRCLAWWTRAGVQWVDVSFCPFPPISHP